jgi:hypothetical protein
MKKLYISGEFIQEKKGYIFSEQIMKSKTFIGATVRKTEYTPNNCTVTSAIGKLLVLNS